MKILYLVPREVFLNKMARERFTYMEMFNAPPHAVHYSGPGWPDWTDSLTAADNARRIIDRNMIGPGAAKGDCDLVHTYMVNGLAGLRRDVPVCTSYNEANRIDRVSTHVEVNEFTYVIFHYANDVPNFPQFARWGTGVAHIPHCADPMLFHDYDEPKDIDVLVTGNMNAEIYPFRSRLAALAWKVLRKRGYRVTVLPHPGYALDKQRAGTVVGLDYARMLSRARLVFTCSSRYRYALTKYSEIAMCRSLAVSDVPEQTPEFFHATTHALERSALDDDILRGVEALLDEPDEIARRSTTAYDETMRAYTVGHYAAMFIKVYHSFVTSRA